jgi:hypothetical protein
MNIDMKVLEDHNKRAPSKIFETKPMVFLQGYEVKTIKRNASKKI